jgi:DNA-binding transcriptional LysR family regulator
VTELTGDEGWPSGHLTLTSPRRRNLVREPELSELRAFAAAASLGSIAAAARSIGVSQPALSKRLRTLEVIVGAELFERSTRGVKLTADGMHLYGAARRVLRSADSVQALITSPTADNTVRLAATPVVAELRLPSVLASLAQLEPGLSVEVISASSPFVRELVRERSCDLGIAAVDPDLPPETRLGEKSIWRDELVIGVPDGHPWRELEEIPLEEFAGTPIVQPPAGSTSSRLVAGALEIAGFQHSPPFAAVGSPAALVATALATGQPVLLSLMASRQQPAGTFAVRRVEGMRFDREFALVWPSPVATLDLPVQAVANHILDLPFARSRRLGREAGESARGRLTGGWPGGQPPGGE